MKLKQTILSIIFIGLINVNSAQIIDGFVGKFGLGYRSSFSNNYESQFRPSGSLGIFKEIKMNRFRGRDACLRSSLKLEALISQINSSKERSTDESFFRQERFFTYLSFPISYKFKPNNFGFHIGFQINMLLYESTTYLQSDHDTPDIPAEETVVSELQNSIGLLENGIKIGFDLSINKRCDIVLDCYRTFFQPNAYYIVDPPSMLMTLGISYSIKGYKSGI